VGGKSGPTTIYVSLYSLHMCPDTTDAAHRNSIEPKLARGLRERERVRERERARAVLPPACHYYICGLILLHMRVLILLRLRQRQEHAYSQLTTTTYVVSYCYICVSLCCYVCRQSEGTGLDRALLHMCPHTTVAGTLQAE
jgi:hypothetical protein